MSNRAGGGGGGPGKGAFGGIAALTLLGGAILVGNNALFNVDGGHRAIKYTRVGGVSKEIYAEGIGAFLSLIHERQLISTCRNTFQDPMV